MPRWVGPLNMLKMVVVVDYKLKLLDTMNIHNLFHVAFLKPHKENGIGQPLPPPILDNDIVMLHILELYVSTMDGNMGLVPDHKFMRINTKSSSF